MTDYLVPALLLLSSGLALGRRRDSYGALLEGGAQGLELMVSILPPLVMLLTAFGLLRASGALELLTNFTAPLLTRLGIPSECAPLILIRPFSGSAALAVGAELIRTHGVDSHVGRVTAVMLGSTETTFYTVSVYFGAAGIRKTRYCLIAALLADLAGFMASAWTVRFFF